MWNINLVGSCQSALPQYVAQFNGQSSYISLGTPSNLEGLQVPMTITGWFICNPTSCNTASNEEIYTVYQTYTQGNVVTIVRVTTLGRFLFGFGLNSGIDAESIVAIPNSGGWHFFAVSMSGTISSASYRIYLDGSVEGSGSGFQLLSTVSTSIPAYIGTDGSISGVYNGMISNLQIYNASLSANQIQYLYEEGIGGMPVDLQNLVGWWPLNGDTNDYSGNNNNGAATGMAYNGSWAGGYYR